MIRSESDFLLAQNSLNKVEPPPKLISNYIEGRRVLPKDSPVPGPINLALTPYSVEIMDCLSPHSPVTHVSLLKGVQIGATIIAENAMGYYMDACPTAIMMVSATESLLDEWSSKRLEPLIDSLGIRHKMSVQTENNKKSRKTGDKAHSKQFSGGFLTMASAQSGSSLRSQSIRFLVRDEIDAAPALLTTGEGNFLSVSEGRTNAWGHKKKIFDLSTPTTIEESLIYQQYLKGDQRKYNVPCPHCDELQVLEFGGEKKNYGLKPIFNDEILTEVYYECKFCHEKIQEYHKADMFLDETHGGRAKWVATAKSFSPNYVSYHLPSFYSPSGMLSWMDLYQKYLNARKEQDGMRSFTNLYLGMPFKERGSRPKLEKMLTLTGDYERKKVPKGVLYLTAAADVQRGSDKDIKNPPRIELEVKGHGKNFKSWSIERYVFLGDTKNASGGAWAELQEFINNGGLTFKSLDGKEFLVRCLFIDSGDGSRTDAVYSFCRGKNNIYPIKGANDISQRKKKEGDFVGTSNFKKMVKTQVNADTLLITISTNYYKTWIYNNLNYSEEYKTKYESDYISDEDRLKNRPAGFMDFPIDYPAAYFEQLTAEEQLSNLSFKCPEGKRNEALDITVYNMAASDFVLWGIIESEKFRMKKEGLPESELEKINSVFVLEVLDRMVYG